MEDVENEKFELTTDFITVFGIKLFRIKALIEFGNVEAGELGGYVQKKENLDQSGNARVSGNADILHITGPGTVHRTTTVFRTEDDIKISCGCFCGNLEEFRRQVVRTRGGKVKDEYLKFADLVEIYFELDE